MELRQLRYFLALADRRHFGRAAETLHIAQPSLSQQIRVLEEELGAVLFDRSRHPVDLTPEGDALVPYARRILAMVDDARTELADRSGLRRGHIRLGTTPTLGGHVLPEILRRFHEKYPGLELSITEGGSDHLARELGEGRLDLALLTDGPNFKDMIFEPLLREQIVVALPDGHRHGRRGAIALTDLRDDGFILCREGYHLRSMTLEACEAAGFTPRIAVSGSDVDTALRFVQAGMGVTLVPNLVASSVHGVVAVELSAPSLHRDVGIAWNPNRYLSKAASALTRFLREEWT